MSEEQQSTPQIVYTPTDILNIVKEHLRTSNVPVIVEGIYQMSGTKAYNGGIWWYDELKSRYDNSKLKVMVPTGIREQVQGGDMVQLCGTITKTVNDYDGKIELMLRVSSLVGKAENGISEEEMARLRLLQQKASKGSKPVDTLLESLLFNEERCPQIVLLYAESSITDADFMAGVEAARGFIDFTEHRHSFSDVPGLSRFIASLDDGTYDAVCIVRGGGSGLEVLEHPGLAAALLELKTPTISAVGHEVDLPLCCKVTDRNLGTPSLLGQYFRNMVENVSEKKTRSRAVLTEKIRKQFQEQLESGQKQNKELQEKLTALTKNQEEATKKQAEQVAAAQKQNQDLQNKLSEITRSNEESRKNQTESMGQLQKTMDKLAVQNAESLRQLNASREKVRSLITQLTIARRRNTAWLVIFLLAAAGLLALWWFGKIVFA